MGNHIRNVFTWVIVTLLFCMELFVAVIYADAPFGPNVRVNEIVPIIYPSAQIDPSVIADNAGNIYIAWEDSRDGNSDIYFAKSTDGGNTFSPSKKVNEEIGGAWQFNPSIAVDGMGCIYIAWTDDRNGLDGDIYFANSTDGGNTFSPDKRVNDDDAYAKQEYPSIAADGTGNIYVAWMDNRNSDFDIYFANSTDGGNTFSPNKRVNDDIWNKTQIEPSIAVDGAGYLYLAWMDDRDGNFNIYFTKSSDGGNTFSSNKKVNDDIYLAWQLKPAIACDDMGYIYITWRDMRNGGNDIYFAKSADGGNTFLPNIKVNDDVVNAEQDCPCLAVDGASNIYISWEDNRNGDNDIYFAKSTDEGITFSPNLKVNDDVANAVQYEPSIAAIGAGLIYIAWRDERNGDPDICFTKSTDSGNTFSVNKKVNDEVTEAGQFEPSLAVDGAGNIYLAWRDNRNGHDDIYFAYSTDGGNTFSPDKRVNDDFAIIGQYKPSIAVDGAGNIYLAWRDLRYGYKGDIFFAKSTDSGNTFSANKMVNDDVVNAEQYELSLGVDDTGNIYIAWTDNRNGAYDIYFAKSTDGGNTFSPNKKISDDTGNETKFDTSLAVDSAGNIFVVWRDYRNGDADIYFTKSTNGGNTFSANKKVNDDVANATQRDPSIAVDDTGDIYIAWSDNRILNNNIKDFDIWFAKSSDGGNTFSANKRVNDDVGSAIWQSEPSIAVGSASNLYVAWMDKRNGDLDIYFAYSYDGGNSFSDNSRVNNDVGSAEQSEPSIAVDDAGLIYVAWTDKRNAVSDIYFTKTKPIPDLTITEIKDSPNASEWVEVYNVGLTTLNLLDHKISLDSGMTFISGSWSNPVIDPGEYSVWTPSMTGVLNDEGATISVHNFTDPAKPMLDVIGYGQNGPVPDPLTGESSARYWDSSLSKYTTPWSRNGTTGPTPGAVNNAPGADSTPPVILDEVCFYPLLPQNGFIELMYIGDNSIDISNYKIICDSEYIIPGGTILSRDDPYFGVNPPNYPPGFDLDDGLVNGDNVYLYKDTGELLDMVGWNSQHLQGMSVRRVPDGYGTYQGYDDPTSEAAGWVFNSTLQVMMTEISDSGSAVPQIEVYNPRYPPLNFSVGFTFETASHGALAGAWTIPIADKDGYALFNVTTSSGLDPEGDSIRFYLNGMLIEEVHYGQKGVVPDPVAGESTARYRDASLQGYNNDWTRNASFGPTWGVQNDVVAINSTPLVILNEVRFYPLLPQYGFIELMYVGDGSIDISDYKIVCDSEYIIPNGSIISKDCPYHGIIQPNYPPGFDLDDGTVNGDNVYLYNDTGALLDMVGWSSSHTINQTVSRVPDGFGTFQGFNDTASEQVGWRFNRISSFSLIHILPDGEHYGRLGEFVTHNLTIINKQINDDTVDISNVTGPWGLEVIVLDEYGNPLMDSNGNGIFDIFVSAGGQVNITVVVIISTVIQLMDLETTIITVQSTLYPWFTDFATLTTKVYPYIKANKTVSPTQVNMLGTGYGEEATITINVSGQGCSIGSVTSNCVDIVFVVDDTGSMERAIHDIKDKILNITEVFQREITSVRFGLVTYKESPAQRDQPLTFDTGAFISAVKALAAEWNNDWPEDVYGALQMAINSAWRIGNVSKIIILIGDAEDHDPYSPCPLAKAAVTDEWGIFTSTIACSTTPPFMPDTFIAIAENGSGVYAYYDGVDPEILCQDIVDAVLTIVPMINFSAKDDNISDSNPMIRDVLPDYIHYVPGSFSIQPNATYVDDRGYTFIEWNVSEILINQSWSVTFNITSSMLGLQLTNEVQTSRVNYTNWNNECITILFPESKINVVDGEPSPPELFIDVLPDGGGDDVRLSWITPPEPDVTHYLIYKAKDQTSFDFTDVWIDTSKDKDPVDGLVIPSRTTFNHTGATKLVHENFSQEWYYIVRAVNGLGEISDTSRTMGKWTKSFQPGTSTFSLPLEPLASVDIYNMTIDMGANYIKWMDPVTHDWRQHNLADPVGVNNTNMLVGEGFEPDFTTQTKYTFTGMPGGMILFDNVSFGFDATLNSGNSDSLTVTVDSQGNVTLNWTQPLSMNPGEHQFYVLRSQTRDGFWGGNGAYDHIVTIPVTIPGGRASFLDSNMAQAGSQYYYMILPVNLSTGERGSSSYSIGVWTEEYLAEYDTFGIPLKLNYSQTTDWFCDKIPNTVGINYFNVSAQRWCWHSTRMPEGAFDPFLMMTEGYQISTSNVTKFTFIGV